MSKIETSAADGLTIVKMNDGKANIMSTAFIKELTSAFGIAARNGDAVLLQSEINGTFSAGFDTKVLAARDPSAVLAMVKAGGQLLQTILCHPRPVVAAVNGRIFPMGLFMVLAADYRIGDADRAEWCLNEAKLGIVPPDFAFDLLGYRLTSGWLSRALLTSNTFSPQQGIEAGIFDEIVGADEVQPCSLRMAKKLTALPASSFAGIKEKLRGPVARDMGKSLAREQTLES